MSKERMAALNPKLQSWASQAQLLANAKNVKEFYGNLVPSLKMLSNILRGMADSRTSKQLMGAADSAEMVLDDMSGGRWANTKVATPQDLLSEIRKIMAYSEEDQPSRRVLAQMLTNLADRLEK